VPWSYHSYVPLSCTFTMFSSLASLLPSALHLNTNIDLPKQTVDPEESIKEDKEDQENTYDVQTIHPQTISDQDPPKKDAKSLSEVCRLFSGLSSQSGSMNSGIMCIKYVSQLCSIKKSHLTPVKAGSNTKLTVFSVNWTECISTMRSIIYRTPHLT
jgi:hypothetical protein